MSNVLTNYFEHGYRFHKLESVPVSCKQETKAVFLIHGWGVRAVAMARLASALADEGFTVYNYDYPTSKRKIGEHSEIFLSLYRRILDEEKPSGIFFVTHSMGGILLRAALGQMDESECRRIEAIVMLGPPNRGSVLAYLGKSRVARGINASLADMTPAEDSFVRNIPPPPFLPPAGIVAAKYDGKVTLGSTLLPDGQPCQHTIVPCTHPGLRNPKYTLVPILSFFNSKAFSGSLP
ncbi:MAG: alpha/beta fold hydrolase [Lentisphaeria bacterium]|nr:alpha/beta fold hydrolase [Lentisphaeria bacterium]